MSDSDEFTTSATPGASLSLRARLLADPAPAGGVIWADVLDPATGTRLDARGLVSGAPAASFSSLGTVVVPASGSLLLRFRGYGSNGYPLATAPYEFFVEPQ